MKTSSIILLGCCSCHFSGCSFFADQQQNLSVASEPPGAEVVINGSNAGVSPVQYSIPRGKNASITVRKKGYQAVSRNTSTQLSKVGVLDIVGGFFFLFPFLGLLADGAWEQEPTNMSVSLPEKEGAAVRIHNPSVSMSDSHSSTGDVAQAQ